jgi:hypothetical protein
MNTNVPLGRYLQLPNPLEGAMLCSKKAEALANFG